MRILLATPEASPFIKTCGLADFANRLSLHIRRSGNDIRVILPLYQDISTQWRRGMKKIISKSISLSWRQLYCGIHELQLNDVIFYFVENEYYFKRKGIYGHEDDAERFAFFSIAVTEFMFEHDWQPDIVHVNDWQTALIPIYMEERKNRLSLPSNIKCIFTVHNVDVQGRFSRRLLGDVFGLRAHWFDSGTLEFMEHLSLMKGALLTADYSTTTSPTYADELKYPFFSKGLENTFRSISERFIGIINGIDTARFDPASDSAVRYPYTQSSLDEREKNKYYLQRLLRFEGNPDIPIVAFVGKLNNENGANLMVSAFDRMMELGIQMIVCGKGDFECEQFFRTARNRLSGRVFVSDGQDENFARIIYAGADIFLRPSLKEPCGHRHMVAMRYGMVPVVRDTGGLKDIVATNGEDRRGFLFSDFTVDHMIKSLRESVMLYKENKGIWRDIVKRNMQIDFSWNRTAEKYINLYKNASQNIDLDSEQMIL